MIPSHQAQPANPAATNVQASPHTATAPDGGPGVEPASLLAEGSQISLPVRNADGSVTTVPAYVHTTSAEFTATAKPDWVDHGS
jgi:hypothetical protein